MAKVNLACEADEKEAAFSRRDFNRFAQFAELDKLKHHRICADPKAADIIVFVGSSSQNYKDITDSEIYKAHKKKCVAFVSSDKIIPLLPGLYVSLERNWVFDRCKSFASGYYLRVAENSSMDIKESIDDAKFLYSFTGSSQTNPMRKKICSLEDERAYIRDTSKDDRRQDDGVDGENSERGMLYRDVMANSKFILCPKGGSPSSWRLFETMRAGRVPVIVSDDWSRPIGPEWDSFALFVAEKDIDSIPQLLLGKEPIAKQFGDRARQEWEKWYAPDVIFNTTIDQMVDLLAHRKSDSVFLKVLVYLQYLRPFFFRYWLLSPIKRKILSVFRA